ncbi:hypothetical protein NLI96_g8731 [Meripilus lineatus]|uniref:DUF4336 domain-containing protein n=1 Tax=Meripilus lineatus TaxID=2056292 RepID=A0AAD5UWU3_9APHY|nr:hypothetical protein NLI96_g8731 [Physisporinus lineatus]
MASNATTVVREVAKDVWIFSTPFKRLGVVPIGGRSTAVKLSNGDVWVLASTPLNDVTKEKLKELGPVKWIIGADAVHHLFLGGAYCDFKREYPDAKLIAVDEAIKKKVDEGLKFDGAWGADPPNTKYGFENDIQHCYFSGFKNKDVAFFHPASKSLIEADLLFNLPPTEQYSKSDESMSLPLASRLLSSNGAFGSRFSWWLATDKEYVFKLFRTQTAHHPSIPHSRAMKRDAATVAGWDFERIIPCHGVRECFTNEREFA